MMTKEERESFYILSSHHQQLKEECAKYRKDIQLITKFLMEETDFENWFVMEAIKQEKKRAIKDDVTVGLTRLRKPI